MEPALRAYHAGDTVGCRRHLVPGRLRTGLPGACSTRACPAPSSSRSPTADAFFRQELPAVQQWSLTEEDANRITQPALVVLGENTVATFPERRELLLAWLPNAEPFDLPDATHLLHLQNPRGMAEGLASFYARHPLTTAT